MRWLASLVVTLGLLTTSCSKQDGTGTTTRAAAPSVGVITAETTRVPVSTELPGRLEAAHTAQVRARVNGVIKRRLFEEGSEVKMSQSLFEIDPVPFKTALASARAAEAAAQAALLQARATHEHDRAQWDAKVIDVHEWELAQAAYRAAEADLAAAKAAVAQARLNVEYAAVKSPIAGRIGRANVSDGARVSASEATLLATVQQINTLYVIFAEPAVDALRLKREFEAARQQHLKAAVLHVVLDDGTVYEQPGRLVFNDLAVDSTSGQVTLRAELPNPKADLLPGLYVKVRIDLARSDDAFLLPKQAVNRSPAGDTVMVVGADRQVTVRPVQLGGQHGDQWVVTSGLKPGEQVVVDGFQKIRPKSPVTPVPWQPREMVLNTSARP